jgi:preprotein translocase subunit SecE
MGVRIPPGLPRIQRSLARRAGSVLVNKLIKFLKEVRIELAKVS